MPRLKLSAITLDCADPLELLAFYQAATGLEPHPKSDAEFAGITFADGLFVGFQRAEDYRAPRWPDPVAPQQLHIDFDVDAADLDEAEAWLLSLGAGKPDHQPRPEHYRVLTDPAGHPFCIMIKR